MKEIFKKIVVMVVAIAMIATIFPTVQAKAAENLTMYVGEAIKYSIY